MPMIDRLYINLKNIRNLINNDSIHNDFNYELDEVMTYFNNIKRNLLQIKNCEL